MKEKAEKPVKKSKGSAGAHLKARLLDTYYGHVARDMKLIVITGTTGKVTVAHYVHNILLAGDQRVAVLASDNDIKVGILHKFLSDAWKAGANYVIITAPASSIDNEVFYKLPLHIVALTDYVPASLGAASAEEYEAATDTLFDMNPEITVINNDDRNYKVFRSFKGTDQTITYGHDYYSNVRIEGSTLFKLGTEANLNIAGHRQTVATFCTGEPTVSYMACASAIAVALNVDHDHIVTGIADYDPSAE